MHNNYFFLKQLAKKLGTVLTGGTLEAVYSQNRNELILEFVTVRSGPFYIKASVDPAFPCLSFPREAHRARRNSVDIFGEVIGQRVSTVAEIAYDRSFYIETGNDHKLLFKMHGNRSNVLLFRAHRCIRIFRNKLASDLDLQISDLQGTASLSREALLSSGGNYKKLAPVFGGAFEQYFAERDYGAQSPDRKWELFSGLLEYLQHPEYCISYRNEIPVFILYRDAATVSCFDDPLEGINTFYARYTKMRHLLTAKSEARAYLVSSIAKTNGYIARAAQKLEQLQHGRRYDQWADIIMANLHQIGAYSEEAVLHDFYNDCTVTIPLKKQLAPQENAAQYYRKSKNQAIEIRQLQQNIEARKKALAQLGTALEEMECLDSVKDIKALMQAIRGNVRTGHETTTESFHRYKAEGWDIFVGKNARTNELLTFDFANKNDYWLHVKDAPGSHVVVRKPGNVNAPKHVLRYAAALAAYHSKRQNESLCPVTVTQKKYVRKGKGMKPGQVLIDREEVLLVPPAGKP